jgi:nitroreductase
MRNMNVSEAILARRSCRAFKPDPVARETVAEILKLAINAPSANNLQPWEFVVVVGKDRERLSRVLLKAYHEKAISCGSGAVKPLPPAIRQHGLDAQAEMKPFADKLGVSLDDLINEGSCNFYGAPVAIIICLDDCFSSRQMVDVGTTVGYLVLAAQEKELGSCPIGLITDYADEIRETLNIPDNKRVIIGLALGYPDTTSPLAPFRSSRADVAGFVRWI